MLAKDIETIGEDWELREQVSTLFQRLNLEPSLLNMPFNHLSGGQKTKILLAKSILAKADFILLDEPTNNLDYESKCLLLEWIRKCNNGFLVVSHDRALLNSMDEIIEMTSKGIFHYGGHYDFYEAEKNLQQESLKHQLEEAKRQLKQVSSSAQSSREKHEQRYKKGRDDHRSGRQPDRKLAGAMKNKSGQTEARNKIVSEQRIKQASNALKITKSQLEIKETIRADLSATHVPAGKNVIAIENLWFAYPSQPPLFSNFHLSLTGPERVAILGKNGIGKSTLIQLILGHLKPQQGKIQCGVHFIRFLDQNCNFLIPNLSLVENFKHLNPTATTQNAYAALASMQFRNVLAEKKVGDLSGGERIRAGLAISLLSNIPPQLILLDEPTNHLDLRSIKAIEEALFCYQGAIIVITHDVNFLENINITRSVTL